MCAWVRSGCVYTPSGAYMCLPPGVRTCDPGVPLWGSASLLQRSIRLVKFMSKIKDPSRMTCKGLVLLLKVFVPLLSLTHLNGLPRPLRVQFTLFSRTSTTIHHLMPDKHLVSVPVGAYRHPQLSPYVPVVSHYHSVVDSNATKT